MPARSVFDNPSGYRLRRHKARTLDVVDDYGDVVAHIRRCSNCLEWLPMNGNYFSRSVTRPQELGFQHRCRSCTASGKRFRRRDNVEVARERDRQARRRRIAEDPTYRVREQARVLRARERMRRDDPERLRRIEETARRNYYAKVKADPARWAEVRENARIDYRLRKMRQGVTMTKTQPARVKPPGRDTGTVPVGPLLAAVMREAERLRRLQGGLSDDERSRLRLPTPETIIAERAGSNTRTIWAWKSGERQTVQLATVERFLEAMDLHWWEIYSPDDPVLARVFVGEAA